MNTSAASADPLLRAAFGQRFAPRTLNLLLGTGALLFGACTRLTDSGTGTAKDGGASPLGSARRSRDAAQGFRHEPS